MAPGKVVPKELAKVKDMLQILGATYVSVHGAGGRGDKPSAVLELGANCHKKPRKKDGEKLRLITTYRENNCGCEDWD